MNLVADLKGKTSLLTRLMNSIKNALDKTITFPTVISGQIFKFQFVGQPYMTKNAKLSLRKTSEKFAETL